MPLHRKVTYLILLLTVVHAIVMSSHLPDEVATHFNGTGEADNYGSSTFYLSMEVIVVFFVAGLLMLPLRKMPKNLISIPNFEYWMAPERYEQTMLYIEKEMGWFGCITAGWLLIVFHLGAIANFNDPVRMAAGPFWAMFAAYLIYTFVWSMKLITRFSKKEDLCN
ncbi:MAG: DUF1648 domain-containing protein [bacterium]|nr:DUF1648 domain-containing protein [bacterium]MCP4800663.1 DUF1648 domain-containing protein [bacterium]